MIRIKELTLDEWDLLDDMQVVYAGGRIPDRLLDNSTQNILHINYRQRADIMRIYFLWVSTREIMTLDMSKDEFYQYIEAPFIVLPY